MKKKVGRVGIGGGSIEIAGEPEANAEIQGDSIEEKASTKEWDYNIYVKNGEYTLMTKFMKHNIYYILKEKRKNQKQNL